MARVSVKARFAAPPDALWDFIGRFNALGQWHPQVKKSSTHGTAKGATREIKLLDGGSIVERLEHVSQGERLYLYSIVDSPYPVTNWVAEMRVRDSGGGSTVEWTSSFTPAEGKETDAVKAIRKMYQKGLDNLKKIYST